MATGGEALLVFPINMDSLATWCQGQTQPGSVNNSALILGAVLSELPTSGFQYSFCFLRDYPVVTAGETGSASLQGSLSNLKSILLCLCLLYY